MKFFFHYKNEFNKVTEKTICDEYVRRNEEEMDEFEKLRQSLLIGYENLKLPSWSGYSSILSKDVQENDLTNIFTVPLIPGRANDFCAIYTALKCAHGIAVSTCGETSKNIISMHVDLFEKVYLLVRLSTRPKRIIRFVSW